MKIIYYANINAFSESGVLNKILCQIDVWENEGHQVALLIQSKLVKGDVDWPDYLYKDNVSVVYSGFIKWLIDKGVSNLQVLNKIFSKYLVKDEINKFSPDLIYTRFAFWYPGFISAFGSFPLVVELNSLDEREVVTRGKMNTIYHLSTRNHLLDRANAFCSVTDEIDREIVCNTKPSTVIGNGYNISIRRSVDKDDCGNRTNIIFVGSGDCPWHGIDKIMHLANSLDYCDIHIVGPHQEYDNHAPGNVKFHGSIYGEELVGLYEKSDMAIGTLALHRKGMMEASPLKVREYVSHGLPVIVGYKDTDLEGKEYILDLGCYENNVMDNLGRIKDFISQWQGRNIDEDLSFLSYEAKEIKRLEFMKTVCGQ